MFGDFFELLNANISPNRLYLYFQLTHEAASQFLGLTVDEMDLPYEKLLSSEDPTKLVLTYYSTRMQYLEDDCS